MVEINSNSSLRIRGLKQTEACSSISKPITARNSKLGVGTTCHVREYSSPSSSTFPWNDPFVLTSYFPSPNNTAMSFENFDGSMIPLLTSSRMSETELPLTMRASIILCSPWLFFWS
ncbi:hypothetical protein TNCV_4551321 [Trichonephila clavipes]|nr:hypothetical protein TNCV_4551321 [Trichonephila clavipes]